jgi:chromate transporter
MVLPGPEAQQLATYLGWLMHRTWGGIVAGALFVLPSFLILLALAWAYLAWGSHPVAVGVLAGIKPAVVAIVLHALWRLGSKTLRHPRTNPALWGVAAAAFVALEILGLPFPAIVLGAGLLGWWMSRGEAAAVVQAHHSAGAPAGGGPALIDDASPTPTHARFERQRLARVVMVGLLLWAAPMLALTAWQGWSGTLTQMGWFFTKAALLTFGGAYAVLPYVFEGAVAHHGWLSAAQMMDGLALGETTPGPLIMVNTFVGFVGGWNFAVLGPNHLAAGAALAAAVVTWFTFLPSFVFILAGGPWVEDTRGRLALQGPLNAITAAVVGVMATLALFFAQHVFWPVGLGARPDLAALAMAAVAFALLQRGRLGVIPIILGCGLLGAMLQIMR